MGWAFPRVRSPSCHEERRRRDEDGGLAGQRGWLLIVIVGVTSKKAQPGFAPIAIGLTLIFIHLAAIPVTNASVNPARSTATAIFGGPVALASLWLFWVAPIVGGVIGGYISLWLQEE